MKNRFTLWLLTLCVMFTALFPAMATTANAAEHGLTVVEDACIYLDGRLMDVDCYLEDGDVHVATLSDLYTVLPDLEEAVAVLPSPDGYIVVDYFDFLEGYTFKMEVNCLFIYTDSAAGDNDDRNEDDEEIGIRPVLNVFFNGVKGPWSNSEEELKDWAARNGYFFRQYGNNVYLNNDGNTPLVIKVNGTEVDFPDQQPIIVNPGRTMVPIRALTDCIGDVEIDWNGEYQRVAIQSQYNRLVLWIGHTQYWYNGQYYKMDVAPTIMNGRTMVPIRFIAEAFGFVTSFDGTSDVNVVSLSSGW